MWAVLDVTVFRRHGRPPRFTRCRNRGFVTRDRDRVPTDPKTDDDSQTSDYPARWPDCISRAWNEGSKEQCQGKGDADCREQSDPYLAYPGVPCETGVWRHKVKD